MFDKTSKAKIEKSRVFSLGALALFLFTLGSLGLCSGSASRGALGGLNYSPGGRGFAYKAVGVPSGDFNKWVSQNRAKVKKTIGSLDKGYVLEVVGHTDSSGPRNASGKRKGNIWYSTQRARGVYNALVRNGFSRSKLSYKGIADDELLDSSDDTSRVNRRVSFRIVSK